LQVGASLLLAWMLGAAAVAQTQAMPPWSGGRNDPAAFQGFRFQVPDVDNVPDLHGNPQAARLVLFIGGNQFFVLPRLVAAFEQLHPELRGAIFSETLPPGILVRQMDHGDTLTLGNLTLTVHPDVYEAGLGRLQTLARQGRVGPIVEYASNDLAILVKKGNLKGVHGLQDLGRADVRLSMPNPAWEGIARQIEGALRRAGGEALVHQVMQIKVQQGTTRLTEIHHRQTPMRLLAGQVDAGVVWRSEALFQQRIGNPVEVVPIPPAQNVTATYAAAVLKNAPHRQAAEAWVAFLRTQQAQLIYRDYGFGPLRTGKELH
jgi:ABC-type molybdate transport system substrate-binding protein